VTKRTLAWVPLCAAAAAFLLLPRVAAEGRAPARLSETGLYVPGAPGVVDSRNQLFSPQYPLWSDGATKTRWVYLPPGSAIDATHVDEWNFPVGTRFWKEFTFNGRKVETRMLWKASPARWGFASYRWNDDQTDAVLSPEVGEHGVAPLTAGRSHSIPSVTDCTACHGTQRAGPLGFTALQLSTDRDPNAIHGEPATPEMITLQTLVAQGVLKPARSELMTHPPRIATTNPQTRAALGYLVANCGGCHNGNGEIAALGPVLKQRELLVDADTIARSLVGHPTKWQVPGVAEGASVLINPETPAMSAILVRMRSRSPSSQMPPLGTVIKDQAAIDALARWISSDLRK
jgi:cytochrome c553